MIVEAWVNWNPDPEIHAFGERRQARTVALCGVMVREHRGDFDPTAAKACQYCATGVAFGHSVEMTRGLRRLLEEPDLSGVIVCRRGR